MEKIKLCVRTGREGPEHTVEPQECMGAAFWSPKSYLYGLLQDVGLEAMEDVDGPPVAVFQRGPYHHVIVGILVEVLNGGNAGPKPGVLVAVRILQSAIINKPVL